MAVSLSSFWSSRRGFVQLASFLTVAIGIAYGQNRLPNRLPGTFHGPDAITSLGPQLPAVAQAHGLQPQALSILFRTQRGLGVDPDGALLFACEVPPLFALTASVGDASSTTVASELTSPDGDPFRLHSFPGASRVIYLDFTGHTTTGTQWNSNFTGGAAIVSQPWDADGSPSTFGAAEQSFIRRVWQRVAEDYAPFVIDVTTEDPGVEALRKTSSGDTAYGVRVVISPTNWYNTAAGGTAYVGSFTWNSDTPCFCFTNQLANGEKYIAEAASHEAGHTLGLYHDGQGGPSPTEYYSGQGDWAPIMGNGYYRPITQFSRGEYSNANNSQDDLAVISTYVPLASDDHGNTLATASALAGPIVSDGGTIETSTDVDVFRFVTGAGLVSLRVQGPSPEPNLDVKAELLDANGQVLQTSNPSTLDATISATLASGTYYLRVSGVGAGDPVTSGYSNYDSRGNYVITGTLALTTANQAPLAVASSSGTSGSAPFTVSFSSAGSQDLDGSITSYSWNFGDGNISTASNPTYTYQTAGTYIATLTVTDNAGLTGSANVTINVLLPTGAAPVFTLQPVSQTAMEGATVIFTASASGSPAPTYQWWRNGVTFSSWTGTTLMLSGVSSNDSGTYTVVATNSAGSVTSAGAVLTLGPPSLNVAPVITTQPLSQAVNTGDNVTLSGAASGVPNPTYQWKKNGAALPGATNATLNLTAVTTAESGNYMLVASNIAGSATSNVAVLTVSAPTGAAPVFTLQPVSQTAVEGATVIFTASASGSPAPTYQWWRNGVTFSSWTGTTLMLYGVSSNDSGTYTVVATNSAGSVTSAGAVLTLGPPSLNVAPVITTQPLSQTVNTGDNVTLSGAASGVPNPTYQWKKNGAALPGATNATLNLTAVTTAASGNYMLVASNIAGSATSNVAVLTVSAPTGAAPVFTLQPVSQTAMEGATVIFTASASGSPAPTYQWWRNGVTFSSWTGTTLTLYGVSNNDPGIYTVVATNSAGSVTSAGAVLTVGPTSLNVAPVITTQPLSQTVNTGANVTLSGAASGVPNPTYQWKKNGAALPGATNATLNLTAVTTAASGNYMLVASNIAGSATSNVAVLTVSAPTGAAPVFTLQPVSQTAVEGATVIFTASASGSPAPTYQWRRNGVTFSSWTGTTLTLYGVSSNDPGIYTVVATNSAGSVTSAGAVLTVTPH